MKKLKVMAIYAHPADPITDCGGTLALHAERGDEVTVLALTHGGRLHPNLFAEEWRKENPDKSIINAGKNDVIMKKRRELEEAAAIIGIKNLVCFDYEDNYITVEEEIVKRTAEEIEKVRPDIIIMDYPMNGAYPDTHTLASIMILSAISRVNMYVKNLDDKAEFHIKQIFLTKLPVTVRDAMSLGGIRNDLYIDITSVLGKKVAAMDKFVSQGYHADFARKFIESHDGDRGRSAGVNFAEAFCRLYNETHTFLPVTEHALNRDPLTAHRTYSAISLREMYPVDEKG